MNAAPTDRFEARASAAMAITRQAGAIAREYFRNKDILDIQIKGHQDPVTAADLAVDRFVREQLSQLFPGDNILSEESAGDGDGDLWVIDPIDGTSNFACLCRNRQRHLIWCGASA